MRILSIFKNDLRRLAKDVGLIVGLLLMPLVMMVPNILSYSDDEEDGLKGTPLIVADYDGGGVAGDFLKELDENLLVEQGFSGDLIVQYGFENDPRCAQPGPACDEAVGRARLADGSRDAMLILPEGLSAAFENGDQTPVDLLFDPGGDSLLITQIEKISQGLAIKVALTRQIESAKDDFVDVSSISDPEVRAEIEDIVNQPTTTEGSETAIHVDEVSPSSYVEKKQIGLVEASVPQFSVLFIFLYVMNATSWSREEQNSGLFRRLLSTPAGKADLIGGKLLFGILICTVQMIILFGIGIIAGNMRGLTVTFDIPAFLLLTLALAACATSLGVLFSSTRWATSLALAPMLLGGLLGGSMIAIDFMPAFMVPISYLMPQRYGILGYQDLMVRGGGIGAILPETGILFLFSAAFLGIALWRFDLAD
jgi:ABC-2 type transport system permease protein